MKHALGVAFYLMMFLLATTTRRCCGGGLLTMKLVHFENPHSQLPDGSCCDVTESKGTFCGSCDYYFDFCLSSFPSSYSCELSNVTTRVLTTEDYYIFQSGFQTRPFNKTVSNPFSIPIESWLGTLSLVINVYDKDSSDSTDDDHVTFLAKNITLASTHFGSGRRLHPNVLIGERRATGVVPRLTLQLSIQCNQYFLVPTCSDFCIDTDDASGHYKCNYVTGSRDCHFGWHGSRCDVFCVPQNDTMGHFSCEKGSGVKVCLPGWLDASTNCTRENTTELYTEVLKKATRTLSLIHLPTLQLMQQSAVLRVTPSSSDIWSTRPPEKCCDYKPCCATSADAMESSILTLESDSQVLLHSAQESTGHAETQLAGPYTPFHGLYYTRLSKSIGSHVLLAEQSKIDESWSEGSAKSLAKTSAGTRATRDHFETVTILAYTTEIRTETRIGHTMSRGRGSHATKVREDEDRPCGTMLSFPLPWSDSQPPSTTMGNFATIRVSPFNSTARIVGKVYRTVRPSFSYLSETHQHQRVSSGTPSLQRARLTIITARSAVLPSKVIRSSVILDRKHAPQGALAEKGGINGVWQSYQHYFITASGSLALALVLAFLAARYKRKNRVQSLMQTNPPIKLVEESKKADKCIDRDGITDHNPYILLQGASSGNLRPGSHRSCTSVWSSELALRNATRDDASLSFLHTTKVADDATIGDAKMMDYENRLESWTPIKCWTPVDRQTRVVPGSTMTMYSVEPDCQISTGSATSRDCHAQLDYHTPCHSHTSKEYLSPREIPASRGCSIPRQCFTPIPDRKSKQLFLRTDNVCNNNLASKTFEAPKSSESVESQKFIKDDDSDCIIKHRTLQSVALRAQNISRDDNVKFFPASNRHDEERLSSAGFGRSIGISSCSHRNAASHPLILLPETDVSNNASSTVLPQSLPSFNADLYCSRPLSSESGLSCSRANCRGDRTDDRLLTPSFWAVKAPKLLDASMPWPSEGASNVDRSFKTRSPDMALY